MEKQSQNNEHSPTERRWRPEAAETVRQMIYHEGELINHRLGWLVTLQGLLFAGLASLGKTRKNLSMWYLPLEFSYQSQHSPFLFWVIVLLKPF